MNKITIDIDKLTSHINPNSIRLIQNAEVKPVYCSECTYFKNDKDWCIHNTCTHNPITTSIDYFTVKKCRHDWFYGGNGQRAYRQCKICGQADEAKFDE